MQSLTLNGQRIAYQHRTGGGKPTVVFANSLGSDQSLWDGVIDQLPRGLDTLTYDLRGHGLSSISDAHAVTDLADDLVALLDALNLENVLLCGLSVGGMVAQCVAARRPDLVASLILSNTAPKIGTDERWNARIDAVMADGIESIADQVLGNWFAARFQKEQPVEFAMYKDMLCRTPKIGYAATCAAIRDADLTDAVSDITVPTLCIGGSDDLSVSPAQTEALAALIPGARVEVLDGVGHFPPIEATEKMAAFIEDMAASALARFDQGMVTRRSVLGDAHVDRAEAAKTDFDTPFQTLITEGAWGTVWSSPGISQRERSMITLALLAAMGNFDEIPMHVRATRRTGASPRDIQEAFQHVAIYAGVPRANHALKLARQTLAEMEETIDD